MNREGTGFRAIFAHGWAHAITRTPVLAAVWSLAILHSVILAVNLPQRAFHNDFSVFYSSAIAFRTGLDPYVTNLMPIGQRLGMRIGALLHDTDTPTALLFFTPFSLMRAAVSHTIWMILNAAALVAALIVLIRPKYSGLSIRMAVAIGAIALLYSPITDNFIFSQRQTLILLLLVLVMRSLDREREASAG
ncbi:MAG: glycosyltransferase 87 family protein, partial [Candidatus Binataceae bacterium]